MIGLSGLITPSLEEMAKVIVSVEQMGLKIPILIGGAVAAVLLVILSILGHKHRKKRLAEKAEQERKRAEKTDNGWFY